MVYHRFMDDTTVLGSFPSLSTPITTTAGGYGIDVVVSVESIRTISDRFANTAYGFFCRSGWHTLLLLTMSSYARVMIELQADVKLKDNIVVATPRIKDKLRFVDDDGNPLVLTGIVESDSEGEVVFDEIANLRISTSVKEGSDKGYGTNSLLEQ
uniref:Uncharacterized protein n=1 Tax=Tanacetum cinerariifolium TaxID=118510 RepID=A0A699HRD2_TANCI|nr:hypothetical protein [Tanacetum cinerariifolium]